MTISADTALDAVDWTGRWVARRLDARVVTTGSPLGLCLPDLLGLALRRNPKRAHLLVSPVLGKHIPADPRHVCAAGRILGALVRAALTGAPDSVWRPPASRRDRKSVV